MELFTDAKWLRCLIPIRKHFSPDCMFSTLYQRKTQSERMCDNGLLMFPEPAVFTLLRRVHDRRAKVFKLPSTALYFITAGNGPPLPRWQMYSNGASFRNPYFSHQGFQKLVLPIDNCYYRGHPYFVGSLMWSPYFANVVIHWDCVCIVHLDRKSCRLNYPTFGQNSVWRHLRKSIQNS